MLNTDYQTLNETTEALLFALYISEAIRELVVFHCSTLISQRKIFSSLSNSHNVLFVSFFRHDKFPSSRRKSLSTNRLPVFNLVLIFTI